MPHTVLCKTLNAALPRCRVPRSIVSFPSCLRWQSYGDFRQIPRNLADSSLTCVDKRLNLGQNEG